jgi:3-dehydroquinate dehydratase-2
MTRILLIQGPNMTDLGRREPEKYGRTTAADLDAKLHAHAAARQYELEIFYTHVEGVAIEKIYAAAEAGVDVLVMNPAGCTYAGYALRDCLRAVQDRLPYVEVHILTPEERGVRSVPGEAALGTVQGFGLRSYLLGLEAALMASGHSGWYDCAMVPGRPGRPS